MKSIAEWLASLGIGRGDAWVAAHLACGLFGPLARLAVAGSDGRFGCVQVDGELLAEEPFALG